MSDEAKDTQPKEARPEGDTSGWRVVDFSKLKNPPAAFAAGVYLIVAIIGGASLIAGLGAFFVLGYDMFFADAKDRIEGAKVFFSVLVALIGGPVLIWRALTAHWAAQAARRQADTALEGHYTNLFTKAVEQLGATREVKETIEIDDAHGVLKRETITKTEPNLEVRLGAIYALDRVARDSERDHWPIMQVLCAYIRNPQNCGVPTLRPEGVEYRSEEFRAWMESIKPPRVDVQAALTVIGERLERRRQLEASRRFQLDLRRANLQRTTLNNSHFESATFDGAHFDGASFFEAHLTGVSFEKTHLAAARFQSAHLGGALFYEAYLTGASFEGAHLAVASFLWAHLDNSSFVRADLASAQFDDADLTEAVFSQAHLGGASFIDFAGARLFDTDLSQVTLLDLGALASALGDASTKLPDGMGRPATWPDRELSWRERYEWIKKARAARPKET